jgi:hypothetical protein
VGNSIFVIPEQYVEGSTFRLNVCVGGTHPYICGNIDLAVENGFIVAKDYEPVMVWMMANIVRKLPQGFIELDDALGLSKDLGSDSCDGNLCAKWIYPDEYLDGEPFTILLYLRNQKSIYGLLNLCVDDGEICLIEEVPKFF